MGGNAKYLANDNRREDDKQKERKEINETRKEEGMMVKTPWINISNNKSIVFPPLLFLEVMEC